MTDLRTRTAVKKSIRRHAKRTRKTPDVFFDPAKSVRASERVPHQLESDIQRAILAALTLRRIWCWRVNSGAMVVGEGAGRRFVKLAPPGTPDILGVLPDGTGRMFGFEVKTATGKQSVAQIAWHKRADASGVRYRVVRSVAEALAAIDEWNTSQAEGNIRCGI